jgi:hypothetical protein
MNMHQCLCTRKGRWNDMSWCEAVWITIHISTGCCGIDNLMWRLVKWLETCPFGNRFLSWDFRFSRRRVWTLQPSAVFYTVGFSRSCHMRWILYGSVCQIFVYILRFVQTMYLGSQCRLQTVLSYLFHNRLLSFFIPREWVHFRRSY